MIPTEPTPLAFKPWWTTFVVHFTSLFITYLGLWRNLHVLHKKRAHTLLMPKLFWVQLPFDLARLIAWLIVAIEGLSQHTKLSWVR
jgi:hypothetical protein